MNSFNVVTILQFETHWTGTQADGSMYIRNAFLVIAAIVKKDMALNSYWAVKQGTEVHVVKTATGDQQEIVVPRAGLIMIKEPPPNFLYPAHISWIVPSSALDVRPMKICYKSNLGLLTMEFDYWCGEMILD